MRRYKVADSFGLQGCRSESGIAAQIPKSQQIDSSRGVTRFASCRKKPLVSGDNRMINNFCVRLAFSVLMSMFVPLLCEAQNSTNLSTERVKDYIITQYGAVQGGESLCTTAIQNAIDECANAGGGRVVVPPGTFLTGTVFVKSNVEIHLEEGAELLGSPWMKNYPPQYPPTRRRYDHYLQTSLIFAQGSHGISVTGKGILNGNSESENDFMADGRGGRYRPCLIWFDECSNVYTHGVTFKSAGFWTQAYTKCRNVHVDGITVTDNSFDNNDGCNIIDCENAIVENCNINTLDDGICLKGYTTEGCKNVVIRNNKVRSLCNGMKMGTDSSGGFQNILIENNEIWETGIAGIALEIVDGGVMQNVVVRNITMNVVETPIFLRLGDRNRPIYVDGKETKPPTGAMHDIHISNIRATVDNAKKFNEEEKSKHNYHPYACSINGIPNHYVERIYIDDVDIEILGGFPSRTEEDAKREIPENSSHYPENRMFGVLPAYAFYIRHANNVHMTNVRVRINQEDARPAFVLDDVHDSKLHKIQAQSVSQTPVFSINENCTGVDCEEVE